MMITIISLYQCGKKTKRAFAKLTFFCLAALLLGAQVTVAAADEIKIGFDNSLDDWTVKSFVGSTRYSVLEAPHGTVLHASSDASASALIKPIRVDLHRTPWLQWRWKIAHRLAGLNERSREGDDYAARIYLIVDGGFLKWKTRALNYVWSSNEIVGAFWPNAFAPKYAKVVAVRGVADPTGEWLTEKRNIRDDFIKLFGRDVRYIDAVAVMTDSDNSALKAAAWYSGLVFSEH